MIKLLGQGHVLCKTERRLLSVSEILRLEEHILALLQQFVCACVFIQTQTAIFLAFYHTHFSFPSLSLSHFSLSFFLQRLRLLNGTQMLTLKQTGGFMENMTVLGAANPAAREQSRAEWSRGVEGGE